MPDRRYSVMLAGRESTAIILWLVEASGSCQRSVNAVRSLYGVQKLPVNRHDFVLSRSPEGKNSEFALYAKRPKRQIIDEPVAWSGVA